MSSSGFLRSRHSLYGTDDRVVFDPGSRVCLVGFSGEANPRAGLVVPDDLNALEHAQGRHHSFSTIQSESFVSSITEDEDSQGSISDADGLLSRLFRTLFLNHLLSDPRQRKVLILESPLLRQTRKAAIARTLFQHLSVPSISFVPHSLCALLAVGRSTGLVIDVGQLETTIVPTFESRPLLSRLVYTSRSSHSLSQRIAVLVARFAMFVPDQQGNHPLGLSSSSQRNQRPTQAGKVPRELITKSFIEKVQSKLCLVDMDPPPMKGNDGNNNDQGVDTQMEEETREEFSSSSSLNEKGIWSSEANDYKFLDSLERRYKPFSKTSDAQISIPSTQLASTSSSSSNTLIPGGTVLIPGWIRQSAFEVLFEKGDEDELAISEAILECLLKVPIDLRKSMISSILVTGGTAMCPGFISRLRVETLRILLLSSDDDPNPNLSRTKKEKYTKVPTKSRYHELYSLRQSLAILNDPCLSFDRDPSKSDQPFGIDKINFDLGAGSAPPFSPNTLAWIGASIAGALKTSSDEITREKYVFFSFLSSLCLIFIFVFY